MKIGVPALPVAFRKHHRMARQWCLVFIEVCLPEEPGSLDGLIIPGGKRVPLCNLNAPLRRSIAANPLWRFAAGNTYLMDQA